jgi:hypothetical protein
MTISETDDDSFTNDDRRLSLIDVSSADDSLIANHHSSGLFSFFLNFIICFSEFHYLHTLPLFFLFVSLGKFFTPNSKDEFDDAATKINEWEREYRSNEIQNNNKINLRQSLAWDTAFFTSPGTLLIFRVKLILVL